jgi:hypothetical protein
MGTAAAADKREDGDTLADMAERNGKGKISCGAKISQYHEDVVIFLCYFLFILEGR